MPSDPASLLLASGGCGLFQSCDRTGGQSVSVDQYPLWCALPSANFVADGRQAVCWFTLKMEVENGRISMKR
jgi:hypothetical protein